MRIGWYCKYDSKENLHDCIFIRNFVKNECQEILKKGRVVDPFDPNLYVAALNHIFTRRFWQELWKCDSCGNNTTFIKKQGDKDLCIDCH